MALRRYVSIVDIVVAVVAAVAIFLPARPLEGVAAARGEPLDEARFALAAAEARSTARPDDGVAVEELSRRLIEAGERDFAAEAPVAASKTTAMRGAPMRWRAQLAAAKAFGELREVKTALEWVNEALAACHDAGPACPAWEEVRADLYAQHLSGGIASGIDPKKDPDGFRLAGEKALHLVHLSGNPQTNPTPTPPPPPTEPGRDAGP